MQQNLDLIKKNSIIPKRSIACCGSGVTTTAFGSIVVRICGVNLFLLDLMPITIAEIGFLCGSYTVIAGIGLITYSIGYLAKNALNKYRFPKKYKQAIQINNYINSYKL